ncbi:hypothetical protein P3X46_015040 [Hevea brasiliensis]|uniref:INO80 complex subunit B-like conserved region domain-containing protein n=1 Tax=Hevea brasiliensis TaxID=3981 RepID=A0ABQ9LWV4_HEVBR|nr:uncharacterized protein LOC110639822 [Hevea brasiliensis]KAJ9171717.1 hypothetical protein P3X46_015040 [Hevea brasiliensis]
MEDCGLPQFDGIRSAVRKKRSRTSCRPKPDAQPVIDSCDHSPSSTTPPSDDVSKASSDENFNANSGRKEFNLNQCMSSVSSSTGVEGEKSHMRNKDSKGFNAFYHNDAGLNAFNNKRSSEGVLAPAKWKNTSKLKESFDSDSRSANIYSGRNGESQSSEQSGVILDVLVNDNKVRKVKLKVSGVAPTIQANSITDGASTKKFQFSETSRSWQKKNFQGNLEEDHSILHKRTGLQGVPWKDFSAGGFSLGKDGTSGKNASGKHGEKSQPVHVSKRFPKRRVLDLEIGEFYEDDEIRYLTKLKTPKIAAGYKGDEESNKKQQKLSSMEKIGASKLVNDGKKKSSLDIASKDTDYKEEDLASEGELEQKKESVDTLMDGKREMKLTTRQRALQSSKDGSAHGANLIEFSNGLPPAPLRKQKEKLSEVEQQLKKADAAQRRRIQVEKAARESEAEAIRKILGQNSSRRKREDEIKKLQEELAKEKVANALKRASNTIRWVMGPNGTVVTFPKEMGFPSIFYNKACSYPPLREQCAGPSCTNPKKYRDSKSKLPLCSLQCYKAIQEQMQTKASC